MEMYISTTLVACACLLAVPISIFFIEVVAAIVKPSKHSVLPSAHRQKVAVVVPAHNESTGLLPTIADVQKQLLPGDRLVVIADNCTDDTASVALAAGAEIAVRHDSIRHGKGYALEFGVDYLKPAPPEIVIFIDADCRVAEDAINSLSETCVVTRRPAQALYLMTTMNGPQVINHQVAEFTWRVKNWIRPLGLSALGLPCQLVGSGMAIPWTVIHLVDLANGGLVEDLKLGIDLASANHAPVFCPAARVTSHFSSTVEGATSQRERWESGHINTIMTSVPRLLYRAVVDRNWELFVLSMDLAVPPLSLLAVLATAMLMISALATLLGFLSPALVASTINLLLLLLAAIIAWLKCGREVLPANSLLLIVPYIFEKLGLYFRILSNKTSANWVRTDRNKS